MPHQIENTNKEIEIIKNKQNVNSGLEMYNNLNEISLDVLNSRSEEAEEESATWW